MLRHAHGFTLIEMAVAVFIIALLLGSILVPLTTQVEQRQISDAQKAIEEIKEALAGFAIANGYLPCPDKTTAPGAGTANDGLEDVTAATGICVGAEGNVPWATLGVASADPWGNRFRYRVDPDFSQRAPAAVFALSAPADLEVCTAATCAAGTRLTSTTVGNGAAAVVLSHGKNGRGAINSLTNAANPAATTADELENTNGDLRFVSRPPSQTTSALGEFDDIVSWLSRYTLLNRMVAAGKLP
jgi:prepilin-type N-terminal cleavage/methylation domain-containing protein